MTETSRVVRSAADRPSWRTVLWRTIVVTVVTTIGLWLLAAILPGFSIDSWWDALLAGFVVGLANAVVWPALAFLVVPLSVLTLGLGAIILNALFVFLLLGLPLVFTIMVVNFTGGYIPYIGAFLGGGLAVIVALGDGGLARSRRWSRRGFLRLWTSLRPAAGADGAHQRLDVDQDERVGWKFPAGCLHTVRGWRQRRRLGRDDVSNHPGTSATRSA